MRLPACALIGACVLGASAGALAQPSGLTLGVGLDYSTGKYGTPDTEETWTLPLYLRYETGLLTLRATLPWVRRTGQGRPELGTTATRTTTEGIGDLVTSASYTLYYDRPSGLIFDLTGKIRFGTADEAKLLGTGENDYYLQGDLFKSYDLWSSFATLGWRKMGDPPGIDYRDPWYGSLGGSYKLSEATSTGLAYDYRERVLAGRGYVSELSAFVTQKFGQGLKLQGYLVKGFADASPDWAAGALFTVGF